MASKNPEFYKDAAYKSVGGLVKRFQEQIRSYKRAEYNETLARQHFINPLFRALGWDVDNSQGFAEAYREVMHEDRIRVGNVLKAPDYSFKLPGGKRLFFVEAKRPSVFVKEEREPAYQVRSYAWSAKLPISILTDFEEFAVYDCSVKPKESDKASIARIKYITYNEYQKEFDFLWDSFSKEKVLKGSFDAFVQSNAGKKGTSTVDREFLLSLDEWRKRLALNIALRNHHLNEVELNFVVQQTLDRIVFLRIAEDRGLEIYGKLNGCLKDDNFYQNLIFYFRESDKKYNSGLFDFKKDQISKNIIVDDKVVKSIVSELYYPLSPYVFTVLNVEILGNAYEQFLGRQIKLTAGHRASIEEKPEVRKAGGVYYTPQTIVDYIVSNSVAPLLTGKTPQEVEDIKIADISCGSGSFLLGAYQYLLNWHLDYYTNKGTKLGSKKMLTPDGNLSAYIKKRILINNIYGVDLDSQAVEVTKLSLLLKCMEGETPASIDTQLNLFHDRVLPTLDDNIKIGNSLIDSNLYNMELDFEEEKRIKPFDWEANFPSVFEQGGFDVIIGNPPWGAEFQKESMFYLRNTYKVAGDRTVDSYTVFVERSLMLLKKGGCLSAIVPDTFLRKDDFISLRALLLKNYSIKEFIETGPVFSQVRDTWCCIFCVEKKPPTKKSIITHKKLSRFIVSVEERLSKFSNRDWDEVTKISQHIWMQKTKFIIGYEADEKVQKLIDKLELNNGLGMSINFKISRGEEGSKYRIKESLKGDFLMTIPEDIDRYFVDKGKTIVSNGLARQKTISIYRHPKIWIIRIQKMRWFQRVVSAVDVRTNSAGMKTLQSVTSINDSIDDLFYLQAVLASKLVNFWCINYLADDINQSYLSKIPLKEIESEQERESYSIIIKNVDRIMKLRSIYTSSLETERSEIQHKINFLEEKIDNEIYILYKLSEEEMTTVEALYSKKYGIAKDKPAIRVGKKRKVRMRKLENN